MILIKPNEKGCFIDIVSLCERSKNQYKLRKDVRLFRLRIMLNDLMFGIGELMFGFRTTYHENLWKGMMQ